MNGFQEEYDQFSLSQSLKWREKTVRVRLTEKKCV